MTSKEEEGSVYMRSIGYVDGDDLGVGVMSLSQPSGAGGEEGGRDRTHD